MTAPISLAIVRHRRATGMSVRDALAMKGADYPPPAECRPSSAWVELVTFNGFRIGDWVTGPGGLEGRLQSFKPATAATPTIAYVTSAGITHSVALSDLRRAVAPPSLFSK